MEHKSFSDRLREYLKENESKLIEGLSAVSYTHLDVYKRQELDLIRRLLYVSLLKRW